MKENMPGKPFALSPMLACCVAAAVPVISTAGIVLYTMQQPVQTRVDDYTSLLHEPADVETPKLIQEHAIGQQAAAVVPSSEQQMDHKAATTRPGHVLRDQSVPIPPLQGGLAVGSILLEFALHSDPVTHTSADEAVLSSGEKLTAAPMPINKTFRSAIPTLSAASKPVSNQEILEPEPEMSVFPHPLVTDPYEIADDSELVQMDQNESSGVGALMQESDQENTTDETDIRNRFIGWVNVGYSSRIKAHHHIGRHLPQHGWRYMIGRHIVPQLHWGARRIMLHNPFGARNINGPMPFDQYIEAKEAGLDWLTENFVEEWRHVVEGEYTNAEPVEVIAYLGSIIKDPDMVALLEAGDMVAWHERVEASIAPLLAANMSIAFDTGSTVPLDHPAYKVFRDLQARGVTIYIETYPQADKPHLHDIPVVMLERYHDLVSRSLRNYPDNWPTKQELGHKVSRLINGHAEDPDDPNWPVTKSMDVLADGDNLIIDLKHLIERGWTMEALLERVHLQNYAVYD